MLGLSKAAPQSARFILPPDIEQGLSGLAPALRTDVRQSIALAFQDEETWQNSALTGDGFPFEVCFHTGKDTFYWTADLARGQSAQAQLVQIAQTATRLGDPVSHPLMNELARLGIPHRAGSWLGGRHDAGKQMRCKLYTDWDDSAYCRSLFPALSLPKRLPNGARARVKGVGLGPGPDRAEIYFRFNHATPRHMHHILDFAGLSHVSACAQAEAQAKAAGALSAALKSSGMIASLAQDTADGPVTVSFYFFPRTFWGNDRVCRRSFLSLLKSAGRNTSPYAAASSPLARLTRPKLYHGLIAFTVSPDGMVWGLGLRPMRANFTHDYPETFGDL